MILCYRSLIGERPGSMHPARDRSWRKRRALARSFMICARRASGPLNLRSSRRRFQKRISIVPDVILSEKSNKWLSTMSRSEEHTSELQSLAYLVCRLLLEKKKKKDIN